MGVYIDRDELLELYANTDELDISNYDVKVAVIRQNILDMPTIDLVRCEECEYFDHDGISDYGRCSKKDVYEWHYKPTDFCSDGDRRTNYTVFIVNPPKGVETPLKGDATVFHKKLKNNSSERSK